MKIEDLKTPLQIHTDEKQVEALLRGFLRALFQEIETRLENE